MDQLIVPKRKAIAISHGVFLMSLAILYFTGFWWPGILLVLWVTLATRQYLSGRNFDLVVTSILLLGLFVFFLLRYDHHLLAPGLFFLAGLYIIVREYFFRKDEDEEKKTPKIKDDTNIE